MANIKIGRQYELINESKTNGEEALVPSLLKMPFTALKNFCLAFCKLQVNFKPDRI
jgi:hypothetical protein